MTSADLAVSVVSGVAALAVLCVFYCAHTIGQLAKQRPSDLIRAFVASEKAAKASSAMELSAVTAYESGAVSAEPEPPEERKYSRVQGAKLRKDMLDSYMDPTSEEDLELFRAMKASGLDPTSVEDRHYWNVSTETGEV